MSIVKSLEKRLRDRALKWDHKRPQRLYIDINPSDLLEFARFVWGDLGCRFAIATGTDEMTGISILYHFSDDASGLMVNLRVMLDREKPEVESLTALFIGAEWIEREMHELLGINFLHHPNLSHLLLLDEWPEGVYPLRQDFNKDVLGDLGKEKNDE